MNLRDESMQMWISSDPFIWSVSLSRSFSHSRNWIIFRVGAHSSGPEESRADPVTSRVTVSREGNTKASSEERSSHLHLHFYCFTVWQTLALHKGKGSRHEPVWLSNLSFFGTEEIIQNLEPKNTGTYWVSLYGQWTFFRISFVLKWKKQVLQVWNDTSVSE